MSYASEVLADNPKAYFRMQEASGLIQDSSGLAHHATSSIGTAGYQQQPSPVITEPSDYFITFIADSFSVPNHADLTFGNTMTVETWAATDDLLSRAFTGRGTGALTLFIDTATAKFTAAKADTAIIVASTITISISTWYHLVYTKDGTTSKLYINGIDRTGVVTDQTLASPAVPLIVGADYNGTSFQWNGGLDEMAFYSTALSQDRVLAHYNAALSDSSFTYKNMQIVRSNLRW